jgi:imidazolonepropionase-like amidohydrolase
MKRASLLCCIFACLSLHAQDRVYAIKAARLFDGVSDRLVEPGLVTVSNGKVVSVGTPAPAGATVIDLGDATLLPGFIDAHTHLTDAFNPDYDGSTVLGMRRPVSERAIRATVNARDTLMAGFTTVRDLGGNDFIDVGLRNSIAAGVIPGPRMLVSVHALGSTGGHCDDGAGFRFGLFGPETGPEQGVVNSPDQARYGVRFAIKYGADVIKTCASGGVLSPTDDVDVPQLSQLELNALVEEAHSQRRKAAAHAHGAEAAKRAIRAGIDSIEHGTFLDDEALRMMHEHGVFLVPTLTTRVGLMQSKLPPLVHEKAARAVAQQDAMMRRALALGVRIALGTDAGVYTHGQNATEFALMVAAGMTPAQALKAGTSVAAELVGLQDKVGVLKPGMLADIVAVPGNPITDIKATSDVIFVMKEGTVFRNGRR